MTTSLFHPATARWFDGRFDAPTLPQRDGWAAIAAGRDTLIAAPTGSGKTLAAFLSALDDLLREGVAAGGALPDETRVVYVSPLKALSSDIHRNLAVPRREIRAIAADMGLPRVAITAAVRSGDTPRSERDAMLRRPPHILVTTPESLHLLLTARRSREILRTARTVIVDEIHAVIESRRGSHLALSLERLEHVAGRRLQRIGLSATQRPIEDVARFLLGAGRLDGSGAVPCASGDGPCAIVDAGHLRDLDLGLEVPGSPLEAVMSHEAWEEIFDRIATLIRTHRTTLVFANTRRMVERVARELGERLGEDAIRAHHGSLAREARLDAESRLADGRLRAIVATASLELGIDIGHVDLVCQLGSPNRIAAFLQRVGRSGHTVRGTPKGRLFPLDRDDLVECTSLLRAARAGELDRLVVPEKPLDILAQQIVAEAACEDWEEGALFELFRRAWPYRALEQAEFDEVVRMVAHGYRTRRGRRGALVHHDAVNGRIRGRKGARLAAITSGGAIPDVADYRVVLEPEGTFVGTLNEDFAIESTAGDIFQLGNTSWRILRVEPGTVRVADAHGEPPTLPFWLGEAPARSDELSAAVADLRAEIDERLGGPDVAEPPEGARDAARTWLVEGVGIPEAAAFQIVEYLADAKRLLGALPTLDTLVLERFFDEAGGMQLVLHAPLGSRVNRAWGLALRKKFCRTFNFELQAAATEDGLLLSLGPQHSFPLEDVFRFLKPQTVRNVLVQAMLDSPLFQTRWRWASTLSLAVLRWRGGSRTPPQIQRMEAEDLLAAVFPDAAACFENIEGEREVPDHPLVRQAIHDGLHEAMDLDGLVRALERIGAGETRLVARDTPEPSPLSHGLLTARPYAFLDDAPLEERRAAAVYARRALEPSAANELGALDAAAIDRVRDEAWPDAGTPDELHDALLTCGFLREEEGRAGPRHGEADSESAFAELVAGGRATRATVPATVGEADAASDREPGAPGSVPPLRLWVATERIAELRAVHPDATFEPDVEPPPGFDGPADREEAVRELLRGRIEAVGPTTAAALARSLAIAEADAARALLALESEGAVLRGTFTPGRAGGAGEDRAGEDRAATPSRAASPAREWCDRRLLARIHRYTIRRLRAEIEPVEAVHLLRFLLEWQHVAPGHRVAGPEGLASVIEQLDGFEVAAAAWEPDVLAARCEDYEPELLDRLCLAGRAMWGRLTPPSGGGGGVAGPIRSSPIAVFLREHAADWLALAPRPATDGLSDPARQVLRALSARGASFFHEIRDAAGLIPTRVEAALGELAAAGLVTSDGFTGLRALLTPSDRRPPLGGARGPRRRRTVPYGVDSAGRWALLREAAAAPGAGPEASADGEDAPVRRGRPADRPEVERYARTLLRRYGVVFRALLAREPSPPPWRELVLVYRRLEARGELRGGRFVRGFSGEQFALPDAVPRLRAVRRAEPSGSLLGISAADPLNLVGILTPGERIPAVGSNRVVFRDGLPVAAHEGGRVRMLVREGTPSEREVERALARPLAPALRWYLGRAG